MKRSPLKRKTPLKRVGFLRAVADAVATFRIGDRELKRVTPLRSRGRSSYARRERAPSSWFLWVKSQPCMLCTWRPPIATPCEGHIEADHQGERARGRKAPDFTCVPMCWKHHFERTNYCGAFAGFNAITMRAWCDRAIAFTHQRARAAGIVIPSV